MSSKRLREIPRHALVFSATDTTKSFTIVGGTPQDYSVAPGKSVLTLIEIPIWAADVVVEYIVKNPNGVIMFHATNLAKGQTAPPVMLDDEYPVYEGCVVTLTLDAVPGTGGGTAYVTIYYK
jgi:hypothetical protein